MYVTEMYVTLQRELNMKMKKLPILSFNYYCDHNDILKKTLNRFYKPVFRLFHKYNGWFKCSFMSDCCYINYHDHSRFQLVSYEIF